MDSVIDEMVSENKYTDDQILQRLTSMAGLGNVNLTNEEVDRQEQEMIDKLRK